MFMSKVQCCGLCRYHKYMALGEFVCDNQDSECYGLSTHYDDVCEEDFKEKWKNTMKKRKGNLEEKTDYALEGIAEAAVSDLEKALQHFHVPLDETKGDLFVARNTKNIKKMVGIEMELAMKQVERKSQITVYYDPEFPFLIVSVMKLDQ